MPGDVLAVLEPNTIAVSEAIAEIDSTPYHSSSNSHRHNHTVSSISHISRATIHEDELPAPILFQESDLDNAEGEGKTLNDRSASLGHIRSKSALIDQNRISIPTKFESFSNSVGFTASAVRRPSVACLKVNVNAARAGKHRIEHLESPALVLETGFDEGQTDPDNHPLNVSCKPKVQPKHRRQRSHRLAVPEDESAATDSWSAYLDTSCDSASNFIPSSSKSKIQKILSQQEMKSTSQPTVASSSAVNQKPSDKKNLLSFVVGQHCIALSQKKNKEVIVIEPKREVKENHDEFASTFIISQGKSITEALRKLSLENKDSLRRKPRSPPLSPRFSRKDMSRLRKMLIQMCTSIVDEAIRNVYDENESHRRSQKRQSKIKKSMSEVLSGTLLNAFSHSHKTPLRSRHKKIWNTADFCFDVSTEESSAEDMLEWSDDQFGSS